MTSNLLIRQFEMHRLKGPQLMITDNWCLNFKGVADVELTER